MFTWLVCGVSDYWKPKLLICGNGRRKGLGTLMSFMTAICKVNKPQSTYEMCACVCGGCMSTCSAGMERRASYTLNKLSTTTLHLRLFSDKVSFTLPRLALKSTYSPSTPRSHNAPASASWVAGPTLSGLVWNSLVPLILQQTVNWNGNIFLCNEYLTFKKHKTF